MKIGLLAILLAVLSIDANGQLSWTKQFHDVNYGFNDIHATDTSNAITVGGIIKGQKYEGMIAKTTNGGLQWVMQDTVTNRVLQGVHYLSPMNVFAVGDSGTLLTSQNGGVSWQEVQLPTLLRLTAITFNSIGNGLITGDSGIVFQSKDQGKTWGELYKFTDKKINALTYTNNTSIVIVCNEGEIWKSDDNGVSWTHPSNSHVSNINDVSFSDENIGYAVCDSPFVLFTTNGGKNWSDASFKLSNPLTSVVCHTPLQLTISGSYGTIFHTNDGGIKWSRFTNSWERMLKDIFFIDSSHGFAVGPGEILRTSNSTLNTKNVNDQSNINVYLSPNPSRNTITCTINTLKPTNIIVTLINVLGDKMATLYDGILNISHEIKGDISRFPSGNYYVVITTSTSTYTRKLEIIK